MLVRLVVALYLAFLASGLFAQDTFSLLAYDEQTGEIVSAGASCIDGNQIPGGVHVISTVIPGIGAVHTQSLYMSSNQAFAKTLLKSGLSAKLLLDSVITKDISLQPELRQYIVLSLNTTPEFATHTGAQCFPWAGHEQGENFSIAGNILLDSLVVQNMKTAFLTAKRNGDWLGDCAMAALNPIVH